MRTPDLLNTCSCDNPQCPKSRRHYNGCDHCMCLRIPAGDARYYAGPRGVGCCKCGYAVTSQAGAQ